LGILGNVLAETRRKVAEGWARLFPGDEI